MTATAAGHYFRSLTFANNGGDYVPDDSVASSDFSYTTSETYAGVHDVVKSYGSIDNPFLLSYDRADGMYVGYSFRGTAHIWSGEYLDCNVSADLSYIGAEPITGNGMVSYLLKAGHLDLPEVEESHNDYIVKMAKRLNPSKPAVEVGVNLAELAALPLYLQKAGVKLHKRVGKNPKRTVDWAQISPENPGSSYLALRYGWEPLLKDVRKLMRLVDAVEKKLSKYRRLEKDGFLRSSSKKFPQRYHQQASRNVLDAYGTLWNITTVRSTVRWCTLYYTADTSTLFDTDSESLLAARRAAYGLNVDGSTMWQIMPWSWMADWFGNFGDYIDGQRNSIGARLTTCLLMETVETETRVSIVSPPDPDKLVGELLGFGGLNELEGAGAKISKGKLKIHFQDRVIRSVTKTRQRVEPQVEVDLAVTPILGDGYRSSILGALAIQRLFR